MIYKWSKTCTRTDCGTECCWGNQLIYKYKVWSQTMMCAFPRSFLSTQWNDMMIQNLIEYSGIKEAGQNINNLRYAYDIVLVAENKEHLQQLLDIVEEESRKERLELNGKRQK